MTSRERMMEALAFRQPDRIPRYLSFWPEYIEEWRRERGEGSDDDISRYYGVDMVVVAADEGAWPSKAETLKTEGDEVIQRSNWGVVQRSRRGAKFSEMIESGMPERVDPDGLQFEDPLLDSRYEQQAQQVEKHREELAVFCKTGGPFLRAAFMRGEEDFLMDIAADPGWTKAFVERVADHITQVGVESIVRFRLQGTGIGIYDDVCTIASPIMGAQAYEKIFLPSLCKMVAAYKAAGASVVFTHCDGNVDDLLEMWVEAGIDAVHPLEARACMTPAELRERFGQKLAIIGGLDNCNILPRGDREEIRDHLLSLIELGRDGGLAISPHSIGEDISIETMEFVREFLDEHS